MEGIAPNTELYETFKRIKQLLLEVYNNIRHLDIDLTDDVRAVFDTWLATNNEIEEQQSLESYQAFVEMAEKIGNRRTNAPSITSSIRRKERRR